MVHRILITTLPMDASGKEPSYYFAKDINDKQLYCEAVMPEEARLIGIGGKIVRKIHIGYIPPQIAGIHDVDTVRVFFFVFSGIGFCDFAFPDPRYAFQEKNTVADQRFMQFLQFLIPSAKMRTRRGNLVA